MTFDDKMRRASAEVRGVVAGRGREPIGQVKKRAGLQRVAAFGGGTLLVLLSVGAVAMAGGGGGVELLPAGDGSTTTLVAPTTTSAVSDAGEPTTTATLVPAPSAGDGDGLSDPSGVPEDWLDELGAGSRILLMEQGVGIAAEPAGEEDFAAVWSFSTADGGRHDAVLVFGSEYEPGTTAKLFARLLVDGDDPMITVFGVAPLGTLEITLAINADGSPGGIGGGPPYADGSIVINQVYQRPEVGRSVFVGSFDGAVLAENAPIKFDLWLKTSDALPSEYESMFRTFGFQGGNISDSYDGPFTATMFVESMGLVTETVNVDSFPAVVECEGGTRSDTPSNQGRAIPHGEAYSTPLAAFEAIIDGELSGTWFPRSGYIEVRDPEGHIAYGKPWIEGELDQGVVMLVEVTQVEGGWTVTRWEASGC